MEEKKKKLGRALAKEGRRARTRWGRMRAIRPSHEGDPRNLLMRTHEDKDDTLGAPTSNLTVHSHIHGIPRPNFSWYQQPITHRGIVTKWRRRMSSGDTTKKWTPMKNHVQGFFLGFTK